MTKAPLTDQRVKNLVCPPDKKHARFSDQLGLYVQVTPTGAKHWRGKYRIGGVERVKALGTYPTVSLKQAREAWSSFRLQLSKGIDPVAQKRVEKQKAITFAAVAQEVTLKNADAWSATHRARTEYLLNTVLLPALGTRPIAEIKRFELIEALRPLETSGRLASLVKAVGVISLVFGYGQDAGYLAANIATRLRNPFKTASVKHHAACLDPVELGAILRRITAHRATPSVMAALRLAPLLGVRPNELFGLRWDEVDLAGNCLSIDPMRMKGTREQKLAGKPHFVPLARQALEILTAHQGVTGGREHVFANDRQPTRPISENALRMALIASGTPASVQTCHGFRAVFRTLSSEKLGIDTVVLEAQLAHANGEALGQAYSRETHREARITAMQRWADYLENLERGGEVVQLHKIKTA